MGIAPDVASTIFSGASSARDVVRLLLRFHLALRVLGLDTDPRARESPRSRGAPHPGALRRDAEAFGHARSRRDPAETCVHLQGHGPHREAPRRAVQRAAVAPVQPAPRAARRDRLADSRCDRRLYRATWGGGGGIETEALVARALDEASLPSAELLARANDPATKQQLRAATDAAIAAGVFGVPTIIAQGPIVNVPGGPERELFWGVDSFAHLERFLAGEDPVTPDAAESFARLVPSATRPR